MTMDRWVFFDSGPPPALSAVLQVLQDYVGEAARVSTQPASLSAQTVLYATLPGKPSAPLRSMHPDWQARYEGMSERWFEVMMEPDGVWPMPAIRIVTRSQDDFTNAVARQFGLVVARAWAGRLVEG